MSSKKKKRNLIIGLSGLCRVTYSPLKLFIIFLVFIIIVLMVEVASARTAIQVVDGGRNDSFNTACGVVNCHKPKLFGR